LNLHALATLAFRLAGLFLLTWALGSLPMALVVGLAAQPNDAPWPMVYGVGLLNVFSHCLLALVLLLQAGRLADRVADREAQANLPDGTTLQAVGLTLVGCWFFLQGVTEVLHLLIPALRSVEGLLVAARGNESQFAAAFIQMAAGLAVTVPARKLSEWCARVRKTAVKEPVP
jgi:hypothetical protein